MNFAIARSRIIEMMVPWICLHRAGDVMYSFGYVIVDFIKCVAWRLETVMVAIARSWDIEILIPWVISTSSGG